MSIEYLTGVSYIELTQGKYAIVDDWLEPMVRQHKWHYHSKGYAARSVWVSLKRCDVVLMHRVVWEAKHGEIPKGLEIDHNNGNRLDNRLTNLELADRWSNMENNRKRREGLTTSNYPGVSWRKTRQKWRAQIHIGCVGYELGEYILEEDARNARQKALNNYRLNGELPYVR